MLAAGIGYPQAEKGLLGGEGCGHARAYLCSSLRGLGEVGERALFVCAVVPSGRLSRMHPYTLLLCWFSPHYCVGSPKSEQVFEGRSPIEIHTWLTARTNTKQLIFPIVTVWNTAICAV
jgi:hypothetical protein